MRYLKLILPLVFCFGLTFSAAADPLERLEKETVRYTLSNGLRVIVYRRAQAPTFHAQLWVRVGGIDEVPGKTGVSHLLEHMAFKGTETIGTKDFSKEKPLLEQLETLMKLPAEQRTDETRKEIERLHDQLSKLWVNNEFSQIYKQRGAVNLNAGTSKDYTFYMVSVPTAAFDLWCWMESERLIRPVFRQFYDELQVVLEERRMRVDDDPDGRLYENLLETAYLSHPNRLPVIGWPSDVARLQVSDLEELYRTYYRPDNMVLALIGDLDANAIRPQLERYFGRLPKPSTPLPVLGNTEMPQEGERNVVVNYDAEPSMMMAYPKPIYPNKEDFQFSVLHTILAEGRSSRLWRELVQRKHRASSVYTTEAPGAMYPNLFIAGGSPQKGVTSEQLRDEIQQMFDDLKVHPVSQAELEAAKRRVKVGLISGLASNYGLARMFAESELIHGNWKAFFEYYDAVSKTTAEDIQHLAQKYLNRPQRTFVEIKRAKKGA